MSSKLAIITMVGEGDGGTPEHPMRPGGVDPGYGVEGPVDPGFGVPLPPVVGHPLPPSHGHPGHPLPPTYPVDPDYGIPTRPGIWPNPPNLGGGHPGHPLPPQPVYPSLPIYLPPDEPANPIELPPGAVWPPLPPALGEDLVVAFVWIVGIGYRWLVIDPGASIDNSLPQPQPKPPGGSVGHPIQPTPEPKKGP